MSILVIPFFNDDVLLPYADEPIAKFNPNHDEKGEFSSSTTDGPLAEQLKAKWMGTSPIINEHLPERGSAWMTPSGKCVYVPSHFYASEALDTTIPAMLAEGCVRVSSYSGSVGVEISAPMSDETQSTLVDRLTDLSDRLNSQYPESGPYLTMEVSQLPDQSNTTNRTIGGQFVPDFVLSDSSDMTDSGIAKLVSEANEVASRDSAAVSKFILRKSIFIETEPAGAADWQFVPMFKFNEHHDSAGRFSSSDDLEAKAIAIYGKTDDINDAGLLAPSGAMIDLNRADPKYGGQATQSAPGFENHFAAAEAIMGRMPVAEWFSNPGALNDLQDAGFARLTGYRGELSVEISTPLTDAQISTLTSNVGNMLGTAGYNSEFGILGSGQGRGFTIQTNAADGSSHSFQASIDVPYEVTNAILAANQSLGAPVLKFNEQHDEHGRFASGSGLPVLPWVEPPNPAGSGQGRQAGGYSAIGLTNTKLGDAVESALQKQLGMENAHPGTRQGPMDLLYGKDAYEVKCCTTDAEEFKVKLGTDESTSKVAYCTDNDLTPHTMIAVYDPDEQQLYAYSKDGIGSFRLTDESNGWAFHGAFSVDLGSAPLTSTIAKALEQFMPTFKFNENLELARSSEGGRFASSDSRRPPDPESDPQVEIVKAAGYTKLYFAGASIEQLWEHAERIRKSGYETHVAYKHVRVEGDYTPQT